MRTSEIRQRTVSHSHSRSGHSGDGSKGEPPRRLEGYDPTCHLIFVGVLCTVIVIVLLVTWFHAPPPPAHSPVAEAINAYLRGTTIYELDFDAPPEFIENVMRRQDADKDALQNGINLFYGNGHSLIVDNDGWRVVDDGLVCEGIGCRVTIKLPNVMERVDVDRDTLWISTAFGVSGSDQMGTAIVWIDTIPELNVDGLSGNRKMVDGFMADTKAVAHSIEWELELSTLRTAANDLYFHAVALDDGPQSIKAKSFKLLGIKLVVK